MKATPESIARGKKWYGYDCAMCHGKDGDGKGDVGADMKSKVSDFTDPSNLEGQDRRRTLLHHQGRERRYAARRRSRED